MDPVSLVVGALAVGVAKGAGDSAAAAVQDAYRGLKQLLLSRFRGHREVEEALEQLTVPVTEALKVQLTEALSQSRGVLDEEVVATARRVMELADPEGAAGGWYRVDVRGGQGVQVGDHNVQSNVFGAQPGS